jgi:hypothetical protein
VRLEVPDGSRGTIKDIVERLAIVADFDRHEGASIDWAAKTPVDPHLVVETSPGNYQCWIFFDRPYAPHEVAPIGKALVPLLDDRDGVIRDMARVVRVPGTFNYPNQKKLSEGRDPKPFLARLVFDVEDWQQGYSLVDLRAAILLRDPSAFERVHAHSAQDFNWDRRKKPDEPPELLDDAAIVRALSKSGDRSKLAFNVIRRCQHANYSADEIATVLLKFENLPVMGHYGEPVNEERVRDDVRRAFGKPNPADRRLEEIFGDAARSVESLKEERAARWRIQYRGEFKGEKPAGSLIPGLYVPRVGIGSIVAFSTGLKSFMALAMMGSVSTGALFLNKYEPRKVGRVAYFVGEGQESVRAKRIPAWEQKHGKDLDNLGLVPLVPNAFDAAEMEQCKAGIREFIATRPDVPLRMIVFDTWNRMMPGQDESAAGISAQALKFAADLAQEFGVFVLIIHHMGKDITKGARGSTAFHAGMDWQLDCIEKFPDPQSMVPSQPGDPIIAHYLMRKAKDDENGTSVFIEAERVALPDVEDTDGEPITGRSSLVLHSILREHYEQLAVPLRKRRAKGGDDDKGDARWLRLPGLVRTVLASGGTQSTKELIAGLRKLGDDMIDGTTPASLRNYLTGQKGGELLKQQLSAYALPRKEAGAPWRWAHVEHGQKEGDDSDA